MVSRDFVLRGDLPVASHGARWLAGERWEVAPAKAASTVMLVRDCEPGPGVEVFMLRRVSGMAFAPSSMVFPGGGCDVRDGDHEVPWAGPSPAEWAERLGCSESAAQMAVAAAVREVFEECGVLLASASADGPLADVSEPRWRAVRDGLVRRDLSLAGVLEDAGLRLRSDLMAVKAHWVTPEFEPRRFDTWFFAALMPGHQVADGDTSEADHSAWVRPAELIAAFERGEATMLPPTLVCLEQVRDARSAAEFVAHADHVPLIMPVVVETPDGPVMRIEAP
jgi:8-oxo-dGTP pyrophosphatase MutT (NUDIX family)